MARLAKSKLKDVVSLAIESTDVRYVTTKAGAVDKWGSAPLPDGLVSEGLITNAVQMGQYLDELMQAWDLDRHHVVTSLPGLRAIPRVLNLPKMQRSLLASAISREARKEMPISPDELYLSWQVLRDLGDQLRIYLLGIPRDLLDAQVRSLQASGIRPYVMDLKPLALIRAAHRREVVLVNLERDMLDIALVVDYVPAIMRSFSLEKDKLDDQARLDRLLNELTQTVRFYNDSHRSEPLAPSTVVCITGRMLGTPQAIEYLTSVVDRPVVKPTTTLPLPDDMPVAEYMTNIGLVMKQVI